MGHIYKEKEFGIVLTDSRVACIACRRCKKACPWDSPQYYDDELEKYGSGNSARPHMDKCDLCIDRIKEGLKPACAAACIMRALDAGPLTELKDRYPDWTVALDDFPDGKLPALGIDVNPSVIFRKKQIQTRRCGRYEYE
jgi:anaerobic dimethyl sulfoxide reductase subunit B (iron-sulfur subunit)